MEPWEFSCSCRSNGNFYGSIPAVSISSWDHAVLLFKLCVHDFSPFSKYIVLFFLVLSETMMFKFSLNGTLLHLCLEELFHFARKLSQWNCSKETLSGRWVALVFRTGTLLTRRNMETAMWTYKSTSGEGKRSSGSKVWNSLNGVIEIILFATVVKFLYCNPVCIQLALLLEWIFFSICAKSWIIWTVESVGEESWTKLK